MVKTHLNLSMIKTTSYTNNSSPNIFTQCFLVLVWMRLIKNKQKTFWANYNNRLVKTAHVLQARLKVSVVFHRVFSSLVGSFLGTCQPPPTTPTCTGPSGNVDQGSLNFYKSEYWSCNACVIWEPGTPLLVWILFSYSLIYAFIISLVL